MSEQPNARAFAGIPVVESSLCIEWFRKPRTKKRRILNKWRKRMENHRPARQAYLLKGGTIVCHPAFAATLRKRLAEMQP